MPDVLICDVAARDGLQNDPVHLAPGERAELCRRLSAAGVGRVEAASFVSPRHVPAMAGAEGVIVELDDPDREPVDAEVTALVLNDRGFARAVGAGVRRINVTLAVTDAFCRRNQGCSREEAEAMAALLAARAREEGVAVTATLAVSFGCPFEGRVPTAATIALAERVARAGYDEIVVADTIGVAAPSAVAEVVGAVAALGVRVGGHFHDTRATGIANAIAALDAGAEVLDASAGGLGGCPFAPGATGNIATEDLVYVLEEMGVRTGVDLDAIIATAGWLGERLGRPVGGAVSRAGAFPERDLTLVSKNSHSCPA